MKTKVEKHRLSCLMSQAGNRLKRAVAALLPLLASGPCLSADWTLSDGQLELLGTGAIVAEGDVATDHAGASVHAAVQVSATPEQVFRTLTDC